MTKFLYFHKFDTHRLRRAGDTRRSVSQDLNAELERLNQPAAARK